MTIEFNCHVCGKLLRTADEKAGRTAKCPGCGEAITVPEPATEEETVAAETEAPADDFEEPEDDYGQDEFGDDEYDDDEESDEFGDAAPPGEGGTRACPMCGESISTTAATCKYCGEEVGRESTRRRRGGRRANQQIEAGEVISTAWEIFKSEMGLCIGATVILFVILGAMVGVRTVVQQVMMMGMMGGGGPPGGGAMVGLLALIYGLAFVEFLAQQFFWAGEIRFLLNIARGDNAEIGDLFSGGPVYLRFLGNSILWQLMRGVGFVLCGIPGIIVTLIFWPYDYVLVDEDSRGIDCLSRAKEITDGNWGAVFLIALAALGINIVGFFALCVGLLFTIPLTSLMFAVAYCQMTGQRTARV